MQASSQRQGGRLVMRQLAPTSSVSATISKSAPSSECVMPRCRTRYWSGVLGRPIRNSVQSGALAATAPITLASGPWRSATARPRAAPTSVCARLSIPDNLMQQALERSEVVGLHERGDAGIAQQRPGLGGEAVAGGEDEPAHHRRVVAPQLIQELAAAHPGHADIR